jgi:ribonucleotide monophosphatase NagD (HAD superfamily)
MTGDRLETDVLMGLNAGMAGALTLTGATSEAALAQSPIQPTYVIKQGSELLTRIVNSVRRDRDNRQSHQSPQSPQSQNFS